MAFENIGIGGILSFDSARAVLGMGRASTAFAALEQRARRLQMGMRQVGQGVRTLGMASVGMAAGMGFGLKQAVDFEHQMGAVAAVTRSTSKELQINTAEARKLGIETAFSATQAAQAMEILGKFGLSKGPLREATKGVTDLAAAEGINLASAARVAVGSLRAMNMQVTESKRAANVLALASASTAANAIGMGESFSYAGGTLQSLNLDYEQSAAVFGLLANRMITGSRAGTGIMALFRGLQGSSQKAEKLMTKLGISAKQLGIKDLSGLHKVLPRISAALRKHYKTPIERAKAVTTIFGRFGGVVFNALAGAGGTALKKLTDELKLSGSAFKIHGKTVGAAAWMARQRLNTVKGAVTLFKSSLESFFITIFQGFLGPMKGRIQEITKHFNNVLFAMQDLERDGSLKNQAKLTEKYGRTTMQLALGVRDGVKMMKDAWRAVGNQVKRVARMFGTAMGKNTLRTIVKLTVGISLLMASLAPLFAGLFAIKVLFGAIGSIATGALIAIKAALLPVLIVVGAIAGALVVLRNEGESLGAAATRILGGIAGYLKSIYTGAILPLVRGIWDVLYEFTAGMSEFWSEIRNRARANIMGFVGLFKQAVAVVISVLKPVFSIIKQMVLKLRPAFQAYIRFMMTIYEVILKIGRAVMSLIKVVADVVRGVIAVLRPMLIELAGLFSSIYKWIYDTMSQIYRVVGTVIVYIIGLVKKLVISWKPFFIGMAKLVVVLYRIGRIIAEVIIGSLKVMFGILKEVALIIWKQIKPGWDAIQGPMRVVLSVILKIGRAIKDAVLAPFKLLAEYMAKGLAKLESAAKWIPGVSVSNIRKLRKALEGFAGTGALTGAEYRAGGYGPPRRARRVGVRQVSRAQMLKEQKAHAKRMAERRKKEREKIKLELKDSRKYSFTAKTSVDGRCVAAATARHSTELQERAGYGTTPWQRRAVVTRSDATTPARAK